MVLSREACWPHGEFYDAIRSPKAGMIRYHKARGGNYFEHDCCYEK